jgi:hypothetical protein
MGETRLDAAGSSARSPAPLPPAGECKGGGAFELVLKPPHPTAASGGGHLLPQAGEGKGVPAAFFWINLAQRRARPS